jgi:hypothetical protein
MPPRKAQRPKLYEDPPGTRVRPGSYGWEIVQRPDNVLVRKQLSPAGVRRHDRLEVLGALGYEVISTRGTGMVVHPSDRSTMYSIYAAAVHEGVA